MIVRLRQLFAFTAVTWRQMSRDRSAFFFMAVLPIAIIVIIGTTFGGERKLAVGIVTGPSSDTATALVDGMRAADGISVVEYDDVEALRAGVRRFVVAGGVIVPAGADDRLADGRPVEIGLITLPTSDAGPTVRSALTGIAEQIGAPIAAAQWVATETGRDVAALTADARSLRDGSPPSVEVRSVVTGEPSTQPRNGFTAAAANNLVLFTFINCLTAAGVLVNARRDGIFRRAIATPAGLPVLLAGMGIGWFLFALAQSLLIIGVGRLAFDVQWGATGPAFAVTALFALVGCGAGLLVGAVGSNEERVGSLTPPIGIILGALGGCMIPLEVFPPTMRAVARAIPHSWAIEAWDRLMTEQAGWTEVRVHLLVLAAMATGLVVLATTILGRSLRHS